MSIKGAYSTIDEVEFIQKMVTGGIILPPHHFATNFPPAEKLSNYIETISKRQNWGKIDRDVIKRVCEDLKDILLNGDLIMDHHSLLKNAYLMK